MGNLFSLKGKQVTRIEPVTFSELNMIEKYRSAFQLGELTSFELSIRKLNEFLQVNDA
jgi:hypothetical protein